MPKKSAKKAHKKQAHKQSRIHEATTVSGRPVHEHTPRSKPLAAPSIRLKPLATLTRAIRPRKLRLPTLFAVFAVTLLTVSTVVWATLGALINQNNADQLVNSYLFESSHTLHGATFPAQHSFLLKWPLFWIINVFHSSNSAFIVSTVGVSLVTVLALAWFIHKLERRPLYFGTICLALTSVLLLVPAQPYAGGLLPVNMAMTTTRNLEYIAYIVALALVSRWFSIKSWRFWATVGLLTVLVASDKLFASFAIGSAVIGYIAYFALRRKLFLRQAGPWLVASIVATILGTILLTLLNRLDITHIMNTLGASPYAISFNLHNLILGAFYAIAGLFTNFGGNPAFDATTLQDIPRVALKHIYSPAGLGYISNAVIVIAGLVAAGHIGYRAFNLHSSYQKKERASIKDLGRSYFVALALIWSSLIASLAFIATDHAYSVDARYVSIWLFTLFICFATYSRERSWSLPRISGTIGILLVAIIGGSWGAFQNYYSEKNAMVNITTRNSDVAQALQQRRTNLLVGDYWRVLPIKATTGAINNSSASPVAKNKPLTVLPLASCTQPREVLTSRAWQPDLHTHGFAYLLSLDKGLTDYPTCNLQEIIQAYGRPNSSVVIEGKLTDPKELILFYDHGIGKAPKRHTNQVSQVAAGILRPVSLNTLPANQTTCLNKTTIMNIVAHEDDDLLFMNPDLEHDVAAGHCVRTVYVTAGDAGSDQFYWLSRERGSEAAYDVLDGPIQDTWIQKTVDIGQGRYVTIASPRQNYSISLIFLHLPDGGLQGHGFASSHYVSLENLNNGSIPYMQSVDGQSLYDSVSLTQALTSLMAAYKPSEIRTQADDSSRNYPDHSDHRAVGKFATQAKEQYEAGADVPLTYYMGYPVRDLKPNVSGDDLERKQAVFFAYGQFDGGVCKTAAACANMPTYNSYLHRQYTYTP